MEESSPKPRGVPKSLYLVDRNFQLRYAGIAFCIGLFSTLLTGFMILWPLYHFKILKMPIFLPWPILSVILAGVLINTFIIWGAGVLITHKVSGPVYRLVRHFRRIGQGKWSGHMRLRQSDELKFVVRNYNAMVDAMTATGKRDLDSLYQMLAIKEQDLEDGEKVKKMIVQGEKLLERFQRRYSL